MSLASARRQSENLTRSSLLGYQSPAMAYYKPLARMLQVEVDMREIVKLMVLAHAN